MKYAFVAEHRPIFSIRAMCRCLSVRPSGFYAWPKAPLSRRGREDERQAKLVKDAWEASGKVYRTRAEARQEVFDYIEMFYNPTRKHARNGMLSPVEFERQHKAQSGRV